MAPDPVFNLEGKRIWVAGETGLVGSALCRRLRREDVTLLSAPHAALDLTRQQETEDWIGAHKPDLIFLAAARVGGIGDNAAHPADFAHINLSIAQNVIHGAYRAGVGRLVFLGSSCIYPRLAPQPIQEDSLLTGALEPTNEYYAIAKIAGVKLCQAYRRQYGCDFIAAMPTNLYGPGDRFDAHASHVIPALMVKFHQARQRNDSTVELWGTGTALREFLYVDDLADALVHIARYYEDETPLNVGSGDEISIRDLAAAIRSVVGYEGDITFNLAYPDGTPRKLLDSTRLHALGWKASTPLEEGLRKTYAWYICQQGINQAAA